jgi:hypothetical protein
MRHTRLPALVVSMLLCRSQVTYALGRSSKNMNAHIDIPRATSVRRETNMQPRDDRTVFLSTQPATPRNRACLDVGVLLLAALGG